MSEPEDPMVRRMRDMGARWNPPPPGDDEIEPKLVDGEGPQGSPDGLGRGPPLERQKARLDDRHGFWLAGYMH